jgi:hypothetical protein
VIPHGQNRRGYPQTSAYEEKKKNKLLRRSTGFDWNQELGNCNKNQRQIKRTCDKLSKKIKRLEKSIRNGRADLSGLEVQRADASRKYRNNKQSRWYENLRKTRVNLNKVRSAVMENEEMLRNSRRDYYYWNKLLEASIASNTGTAGGGGDGGDGGNGGNGGDGANNNVAMTTPTWDRFNVEDATHSIDISLLQNSNNEQRYLVFSGTDYGIRKMSVTVAQSQPEIQGFINRFNTLGKYRIFFFFFFIFFFF